MRSHSQELRQDPAWKVLDEPNRKGGKDEPTDQVHLVSSPEPPTPSFLFQG